MAIIKTDEWQATQLGNSHLVWKGKTVFQNQLVEEVSALLGVDRIAVKKLLNTYWDVVLDHLKNAHKINIVTIGTFCMSYTCDIYYKGKVNGIWETLLKEDSVRIVFKPSKKTKVTVLEDFQESFMNDPVMKVIKNRQREQKKSSGYYGRYKGLGSKG